jgi:hypothetical protein
VRRWSILGAALACLCCAAEPAPPSVEAPPPRAEAPETGAPVARAAESPPAKTHLGIRGSILVNGGKPFEWRGISAFRLVEQVAHGREAEAIAYLDWARAQKVTVVRVFVMAKHLFELTPADGLKALPRLLALAAERDLVVEVVALADTAGTPLDLARHVQAVAAIAAAHPGAVVEIANEPWHATQDPRLHDPAFVKSLADLVPAAIPVALGSIEGADGYAAAGRYATWHSPRSSEQDGWGHVLELAQGAALVEKWGKPIVADEPIGAAAAAIPGRRDDDPRRFGAAASLTRLAGLGATFHYEAGLHAGIPRGRELECFQAWSAALDALARLPEGGRFLKSADVGPIATMTGVRAAFARQYDTEAWLVLGDPTEPALEWKAPWKEASRTAVPGAIVVRAVTGR